MTPAEWQRVRSVLESALELDPSSRAEFLDSACADPTVRHEVESLIRFQEESGSDFLNAPVNPTFLFEEEARFRLRAGTRIGPYVIVDEIAQGGMGAVYRAARADGQYKQEVALKIVRADFGADLAASRFRNERQILASLDHPNIARVLDGGTTGEGLPYFVMELIDGLPITNYCDRNKLSIDARLKLFRTVCSAVQYAHQRLIIHRDIKPTNILITSKGVPKLLDFGIAKILDKQALPENAFVTRPGQWLMTPEYASPEQLTGEVVTTAADVYSLGLVLYELLTGHRPYTLAGRMPHEIAQVVSTAELRKPSLAVHEAVPQSDFLAKLRRREDPCALRDTTPIKLRKKISGDIDNIVLMALRKEPARRYASVEQFAEDVRRHLAHVPVLARADTPWYRTSKFFSRHKTGVAASFVAVLAVLSGLLISLHEARVATKQAQIAEMQRLRAEHRFNDVRKLANALMFEVHDSIRDLPGATPARKLVVDRALEYLDSLSQEARGDTTLQRELAAAYDRVGDLLGYNGAANLGDFPGALQSYKKALTIRELSASALPNDVQVQSDLLNEYFRLGFVLQDAGDYKGAIENLQRALPVARMLTVSSADPKYIDSMAGLYWKMASVSAEAGDNESALQNFRKSITIREPIAGDANSNPMFRTHLAADYIGLGKALGQAGESSEALESSRNGMQILEKLSQASASNATIREYLGEAYDLFSSLLTKSDRVLALRYSRKSHQIFAELLAADPADALARDNLALSGLRIGEILLLQGKPDEALPYIREAASSFEELKNENRYQIAGRANAYSALGAAYVSLARLKPSQSLEMKNLMAARSWYRRSLQTWWLYRASGHNLADDQSQRVVGELAKCEGALAKIQGVEPGASAGSNSSQDYSALSGSPRDKGHKQF